MLRTKTNAEGSNIVGGSSARHAAHFAHSECLSMWARLLIWTARNNDREPAMTPRAGRSLILTSNT